MDKLTTIKEAVKNIKNGDTIMIGGFMGNGAPPELIDALIEKDIRDITLISSDTAKIDYASGKLIRDKRVKKLYASHIGTNKETGRQMTEGELDVELVPQGTLVERIRAAGFGLGGILTTTGVGTRVEEGKQKLTVDGVNYLLETPLHADVALINAKKADKAGNLQYQGSMVNFNAMMAAAAKTTIVEVDEVVEKGEMDPNLVMTPGVFVDYVVKRGEDNE
ncbi:butyryl-CoA:acetoacetate CoA-transferase alpha subunit [Pelagirhabdus alkalitolerans]|uniref:Butyryl-CoA:acetoacetate CoA-transferase alpha subunit n=1 Tax=Pelagirhabdus alkalitolerans TaxID=1612202 RepID=A0A1G6M2N0_9BACI|nr:CoA transferase subunit A [Pelagirhabdus alkalitolerans]SDC49564.1 butyryl-CoA:acetoacetate CoA-transferase alpha subunit [Pelagirhabdus alkalitolerans]